MEGGKMAKEKIKQGGILYATLWPWPNVIRSFQKEKKNLRGLNLLPKWKKDIFGVSITKCYLAKGNNFVAFLLTCIFALLPFWDKGEIYFFIYKKHVLVFAREKKKRIPRQNLPSTFVQVSFFFLLHMNLSVYK